MIRRLARLAAAEVLLVALAAGLLGTPTASPYKGYDAPQQFV